MWKNNLKKEEEKQWRLEQEKLGKVAENIVETKASFGDLEVVSEDNNVSDNKTTLEISTSEGDYPSEEDIDDAAIFFDFFDGEVDV